MTTTAPLRSAPHGGATYAPMRWLTSPSSTTLAAFAAGAHDEPAEAAEPTVAAEAAEPTVAAEVAEPVEAAEPATVVDTPATTRRTNPTARSKAAASKKPAAKSPTAKKATARSAPAPSTRRQRPPR